MKKLVFLILLRRFYIFFLITLVNAQTSQQIEQAKKYIKDNNITESTARSMAKSQGFSDSQIDAVVNKEKESLKSNQIPFLDETQVLEKEILDDIKIKDEEIIENDLNDLKNDLGTDTREIKANQFFGYDIFKRDPSLFQSSSYGATDPSYLIGPGDEIILMLWGETQFRQVLNVDREGFIFIPDIGQVFVNGLNLNLLESKLFRVLSKSYDSLDPGGREATTFLDVSLGNLRPLRIQVLGEVAQPGSYTVSPSATMFSSLYYFNGPTVEGSLREILLIRNNKEVNKIDFYDYLLTGKKQNDQKLQLDDVIFIPKRLKTVTVLGEVKKPGIYELKSSEKLKDLINISGGLKIESYLNLAQINRIVPFTERKNYESERLIKDLNLSDVLDGSLEIDLFEGDVIKIFSIKEEHFNSVQISGSVKRPGTYEFIDGMDIALLIDKADGLNGDAYLDKVDLIRTKNDNTEEFISLSLDSVNVKNGALSKKLQPLDRLRIYGLDEIIDDKVVSITGSVKFPGTYSLQENLSIRDLIFKSGSLVDDEFRKRIFLERADLVRFDKDGIRKKIINFNINEILKNDNYNSKFSLQPGDLIRIYSKDTFNKSRHVDVSGVIRKPGRYVYKNKMTIQDLILESGGMTEDVYMYKVEVARIDTLNSSESELSQSFEFTLDNDFTIVGDLTGNNTGQKLSDQDNQFFLQPYDQVSIRPNHLFNLQKIVTIQGEINYPGNYAIINKFETMHDIIQRAGGLRYTAYGLASTLERNGKKVSINIDKILKNPKSSYNFIVDAGDIIFIAKRPYMVSITGEVNKPGFYYFQSRKKINYYLRASGGLNPDGDFTNIFITYPNGISKKYNRFFGNHKVLDGSEITIGKKEETEPFDRTEFAKEVTSIFANLAQAIGIIILARQ